MIPSAANSDYPIFVADQVLTSDNLNDLFGYLDEQGRMTRTNLLGMGIVCGLQVITAGDGSSITITKGVGVTSAGYLVAVPEITFTKRTTNIFDAVKCTYYDKFVDTTTKTQRFNLWELQQDAQANGTTPLDNAFLADKVVMLFVELLEENNKNCDPNSCDDKGTTVTVNFRPLLVSKTDTTTLITPSTWISASSFTSLPDIFIPRWNVPNNNPVNADNIIAAYKNILTLNFITTIQNSLSTAYQKFQQVITQEYPTDPFASFNLIDTFVFLYNGSINTHQSIHIQYYYDFFCDLVAAYNEFCTAGNEIISTCCPDETLFPRHLLLGEAIPLALETPSAYRHFFIYSPLFQRNDLFIELKSLFRRMELMIRNFDIPAITSSGSAADDAYIKINPSNWSRIPLSGKAIPFYYAPNAMPKPLYLHWNINKQLRGRSNQILSYNSNLYNNIDDFVINPLKYDLEPYNFLRIEGITGKNVATVLDTIKTRINNYRLPVKVIALSTGSPISGAGSDDDCCCFSDIQLQFKLLIKDLLCCFEKNIKYWGAIEEKDDGSGKIKFVVPDVIKYYEAPFTQIYSKQPVTTFPVADKSSKKSSPTKEGAISAETNLVAESKYTFVQVESMAIKYKDYQLVEPVSMGSLPAPKLNTAVKNIPYYILILIDELKILSGLLEVESIEAFNSESFSSHAEKLNKACTSFEKLLSDYDTTSYYIEKIRVNTSGHDTDIDTIETVMPVMTAADANSIILLLLNLSSTTAFINDLKYKEGQYTAQHKIITSYSEDLDKDGMMVPIMEEPTTDYTSPYRPMLDYLKENMCQCLIDKLKYLLEQYKEQLNSLTDLNNFSVYTQHHPGVQHSAGVSMGGTFLIIYKGTNDPRQDISANTVIADFFLPFICCSDCAPIEVTIQQPPTPVNQPPVARPGDDLSFEQPINEVILDGSLSSDPDGTINAYAWLQVSGPSATNIESSNAAITRVALLNNPGEYVFSLTVTDNQNATGVDTIKITIQQLPASNEFPVAIAGDDVTLGMTFDAAGAPTTAVELDGSNSYDPENGVLTFAWREISNNPNATFAAGEATKSKPKIGFTSDGIYTFELKVTDDHGNAATDTVIITMLKTNVEPVLLEIVGKPGPFCNGKKNANQVRLLASPTGGTFSSNPGGIDVQNDVNGFFFTTAGIPAGVYTLIYSFNDGRGNSVLFEVSQSFTVKFTNAKATIVDSQQVTLDLLFAVTNIPEAHYQWDFKVDDDIDESQETNVNNLTINVSRDKKIIKVHVSVSLGGCSAQVTGEFEIKKLL